MIFVSVIARIFEEGSKDLQRGFEHFPFLVSREPEGVRVVLNSWQLVAYHIVEWSDVPVHNKQLTLKRKNSCQKFGLSQDGSSPYNKQLTTVKVTK